MPANFERWFEMKRQIAFPFCILTAVSVAIVFADDNKSKTANVQRPRGAAPSTQKSPPVVFMGVGDNAMRAVFLCDSSGSMMTKFDTLRAQLRKAVDGLIPAQMFGMIFFSEESY